LEVDPAAPVRAAREVAIEASRELVWSVLTRFEEWPSWNTDVESVEVGGRLQVGTFFRWKAGPGWITSRVEEVSPPFRIAWSGRTMGIRAIHVYQLTETDEGTHVRSDESWRGVLPLIFRGRMLSVLDDSLGTGLAALKAEAERQAQSSFPERAPPSSRDTSRWRLRRRPPLAGG